MTTAVLQPRSPFDLAADIIDPPQWEAPDRDPLKPHQLPPKELLAHQVRLWLLEAGRGAGKTEACARYFTGYMRARAGSRGRIIAPTYDDAVESCLRGPSGLLTVDPEVRMVTRPGGTFVLWPNGSEAVVLGTPTPREVERLRALGNRDLDWWEEMAANPQLKDAWDQAALGLRRGEWPHAIASTTPKATAAYRKIRDDEDTVLTKASMFDNLEHLAPGFIEAMRKKYEGTRLGRQELYGELLEDVEGALWTMERLDASRVPEAPRELAIVVTAVDPAATATEDSDDTGVVVAALGMDGHGYLLADRTCHLKPDAWGSVVVTAHYDFNGDYVVGEVNNGGDMVEHVIYTTDASVPFKQVRASRGKAVRAQPVATLWGKPKDEYGEERKPVVHVVGSLPELEDQLRTWVPGEEDSPDRLDAAVWALTELMLKQQEEEDLEFYEPVKIGADI